MEATRVTVCLPSLYKKIERQSSVSLSAIGSVARHWQLRQDNATTQRFATKNVHYCFRQQHTTPFQPQDARLFYNPTHLQRFYTFYGLSNDWELVEVRLPMLKTERSQHADQVLACTQKQPNLLL